MPKLSMRLSDEEAKRVNEAATRKGQTVSTYVRSRIPELGPPRPPGRRWPVKSIPKDSKPAL